MTPAAPAHIHRHIGADAVVERTLDGFYATVHIVRLRGGDLRVVKSFHRRGIAEGEAVAIERLARVTGSRTAVPEVLDVRVDGECDVIVQSYLPGEPASDVAAENGGLGGEGRAALAGEVCDIVEHWHSTRGTVFEDRQGGRHSSFTASYTADIEVLAAWLGVRRRYRCRPEAPHSGHRSAGP